MSKKINLPLMALITGSLLVGCQSDPGQFAGGSYQQVTLNPTKQVSKVTVLRLTAEAQKEMLQQQGVSVIGKSAFPIDSDNINHGTLEDQAKAQAESVGANVVLLSQTDQGQITKTKIVEQKSELQQAAEDIPLAFGVADSDTHSSSSSSASYKAEGVMDSDGNLESGHIDGSSESSGHSSSFSMIGAATLSDLTALIPGSIVHKKEKYKAEKYEIHAIYLRNPNYPGLK